MTFNNYVKIPRLITLITYRYNVIFSILLIGDEQMKTQIAMYTVGTKVEFFIRFYIWD